MLNNVMRSSAGSRSSNARATTSKSSGAEGSTIKSTYEGRNGVTTQKPAAASTRQKRSRRGSSGPSKWSPGATRYVPATGRVGRYT